MIEVRLILLIVVNTKRNIDFAEVENITNKLKVQLKYLLKEYIFKDVINIWFRVFKFATFSDISSARY